MTCRVFPVLGRDPENGTGLITLRRPVGSIWPAIAALRGGVKTTSAFVSTWWELLCNSNLVAIRRKQSDRLP